MSDFAEYSPGAGGARDEQVVVRVADASDAASIAAVDATRGPRLDTHLAWVSAELARTDAFHVVAEVDGVVIGSSAVKVWSGHADAPLGWYVSGITVLAQWRRRQVADRMLEAELAWMDATGGSTWSVVAATNRASLDLHARHGFREVARAVTFAGITFTGGTGVLLRRRHTGVVTPTYRVMTVCTGNICRSPMAAIVLQARFAAAGLDHVVVDSAGTSEEERGNPVDPRARRVLERHGYLVPAHRARRVTAADLQARDLVLTATATHLHALERLLDGDLATSHLRMMRSFDPATAGATGHQLDLADPWYGVESDFEETLAMIEAAADGIVQHVRAHA